MYLYELLEVAENDVEVWDDNVDISTPVYEYSDYTYEDNDEDYYLHKMEEWFRNLEIKTHLTESVFVDVFSEIEKRWEHIVDCMKEKGRYSIFLYTYGDDILDDDEAIADYVQDVFKTLSLGIYGMAKDFCEFMGL